MGRRHLSLEQLESREVPATYRWNPHAFIGDFKWTTTQQVLGAMKSNWDILNQANNTWSGASTYPTEGDTAIFTPGGPLTQCNTGCTVDAAVKVKRLITDTGYTETIYLDHNLTVAGGVGNEASKLDSDGAIEGTGGELRFESASVTWWNGPLKNLTVAVTSPVQRSVFTINDDGNSPTRRMENATLDLQSGRLDWSNGDVPTTGSSSVWIRKGSIFLAEITDRGNWGTDPNSLVFVVEGRLGVGGPEPVAIHAKQFIINDGSVTVAETKLRLSGSAEQTGGNSYLTLSGGGTLELLSLTNAVGTYGLRDGYLFTSGDPGQFKEGTIKGNLAVGNDPDAQNYNPAQHAKEPVVNPGNSKNVGTLNVTGNLRFYQGRFENDVAGAAIDRHDLITVQGTFNAHAPVANFAAPRKVVTTLLPVHDAIGQAGQAAPKIDFLTYTARGGDFTDATFVNAANWQYGKNEGPNDNPMKYWVQPPGFVPEVKAKAGGIAWLDNGAVPGVFEPGVEQKLAGVTVRLFDEAGTTQLATTVTDANGNYEFDDLAAGIYVAEFVRPTGQRFAAQDAGTDDAFDSDADQTTGRVTVALYDDQLNVSAGLYENAPPTLTTGASVTATTNTQLNGTVLAFATDGEGDTLTASLGTTTTNGALVLNADGTFTYTPNSGFTGTDSFTYVVSDGFGGSATGTVNVTVSAPTVTLTGRAWSDTDLDNLQDAGEGGVSGVLIQLLDIGGNVLAVAYTNSSGEYEFANIAAGQYRLRVTLPPEAVFAEKDEGQGADDIDSDFLFDGYGDIISLPSGGSADFDVGFVLNTVTIPL